MGLCKCRAVTGAFCYEHRRNVCERCIVADHKTVQFFNEFNCKCHVAPYLQWLSDCTVKTDCSICGQQIDQQENVRLPCFHRFHKQCLQNGPFKSKLLTGMQCPDCRVYTLNNVLHPKTLIGASVAKSWPNSGRIQIRHGIGRETGWSGRVASAPPAKHIICHPNATNSIRNNYTERKWPTLP